MPKMRCPCDEFTHDLTPIPDDGWMTIRDKEFEAFIDEYIRDMERPAPENWGQPEYEGESVFTGRLYECPKCGRIMWRSVRDSDTYRVFRPDDDYQKR